MYNLKENGEALAYIHASLQYISDRARACYTLLLPWSLAASVWILYRCLSLVQTSAEK